MMMNGKLCVSAYCCKVLSAIVASKAALLNLEHNSKRQLSCSALFSANCTSASTVDLLTANRTQKMKAERAQKEMHTHS
jgi:hypothetical protein